MNTKLTKYELRFIYTSLNNLLYDEIDKEDEKQYNQKIEKLKLKLLKIQEELK